MTDTPIIDASMRAAIAPGGNIEERKIAAANALEEQVGQVLAGAEPDVQGAALAGGLAIWLMGHRVAGNPKAAAELRRNLLELHIEVVRELLNLYEGIEE